MIKKFALALLLLGLTTFTVNARGHRHHYVTGANLSAAVNDPTDNADDAAYNSGWTNGTNGGSGYGAWANLETTGTMGGQGLTTTRQVDGIRSFQIFAGTASTYAEGRPITSPISLGLYTLTARFDLDNATSFSGFNVKSAAGATFGANELLSFGLTPGTGNNGIFVGGSVSKTIDLGHEIRGDIIQFSLSFNTTAGTYSLTATDTSVAGTGSVSGNLKSSGSPVSVLGFGNFNSGTTQNLIFDSISINPVPEPSTLSLLAGPAILGVWFYLRRRRNS